MGELVSIERVGSGPRRSPSGGGYARGEEARRRIVEAALSRFAEEGYDRASTRRIAQDAAVSPPALQYYFNGKDGLHMACAHLLAARFTEFMGGAYAMADEVARDDPHDAIDALVVLIDAVMDYLSEYRSSESAARFMARGQGEEGSLPAYQWLREVMGRELNGRALRLVANATGTAEDDPMTRVRTVVILAPIKAFYVGRADVAARLGWPDLQGPRLALIKQVIAEQTKAALQAARAGGS